MKVAPSHEVKHLAYLYTKAKHLVINWLVETKPSFKNDKELLNKEWYERLKQIGLTACFTEDREKDSGNVYESWIENPNRNKTLSKESISNPNSENNV